MFDVLPPSLVVVRHELYALTKESAAESVFCEVTHPDTTAGVSEPKVIASEATDIATPPASRTIEDILGS